MPNQWNSFGEGLTRGLSALGQGFIVKGQKNQADEDFANTKKALQDNYAKLMGANTSMLNKYNQTEQNPNVSDAMNTYNMETGKMDTYVPPQVQEQPTKQPTQDANYQKLILDAYTEGQLKLLNNPYGQTNAKVLEDYYGKLMPNPKYEIVKGKNDSVIAVNPYNPKDVLKVQDATPVTETWAQVPGSKSFTSEENGKYYVTQMKQSKDGETKLVKTELNKEDYESWKKYNPTFEDKEAIKLDNKVSFKMSFPNLGRGGTKKTKEEITQGTNDVMKIINKAKNQFVSSGGIPTAEMQDGLAAYGIDISSLTANDAKTLFEKFSKMTEREIRSYIQNAFFND